MATKRKSHELVPFLAIWAVEYQKAFKLNGLHPRHYDLMKKYGARMVDFKRATNDATAPAVAVRPQRKIVRAQSSA